MGDMGTRRGSGQCATPSVAKNVKYFDFFAVKQFKLIYYPEPIGGLFRKNSDMSKSCGLYFENDIAELDPPSVFRQWAM